MPRIFYSAFIYNVRLLTIWMVCFYIFRGHDHCYYHYFYVILPGFFFVLLHFILYSVLSSHS